MQPARAVEVELQLIANAVLECGQRRHAKLFCQLIVDGQSIRRFDLRDPHREFRRLSGELAVGIVLRECHPYEALVASLCSDQLFLKTLDQLSGTKHETE